MRNTLWILSIAAVSFTSCKKEEMRKDGPKPAPIVTAEVKNLTGYQEFPASIQGIVNNDVRAKIQGYITQVLVDEGQYVTKGQALFRLETNMLNENADAARSGITAAQASVQAARAGVSAAKVEVDKLRPLVAKNIISSVQLQTAEANLARANAQLAQASASQQQATATYKGVQANIDYSVIRAPISGVVGRLPLKVGSLVGPTDQVPLTTISDTREVYAYFSMNEKEYLNFLEKSYGATVPEKLRNMPMVELALANGSMYGDKGRIEAVTGQVDANTGTIQFRAGFPNASKLLTNGNSGTVKIPIDYSGALVVPESATYEQQGIVYIYKVGADNKVKSTDVQVKDRVNNMAIITSGVQKGDNVVALGVNTLKDGLEIIPKPIKMDSLVQTIKPIF